jgi:hypothetical protein
MASPYFQQIRVQQPDFSPITRGAEAYGRGIGEAFRSIGKLGGMYFQEKGYEQQISDYMQTEMGQKMMSQAGLKINPDNPKETLKHAKGIINSFGGFKEFQNAIHAEMQAERAQEVANQQNDLFEKQKVQIDQQIEEKEYLLDRLNIEQELGEKKNSYFQHLNKKNENGVRLIDTDDPTAGFDASNPVALQAVMSVNQELGLGVHNPAIIGMMSDSLAADHIDNITGEQMPYRNYENEAEMYKHLDKMFQSEYGKRLPPEQRNAIIDRQKLNIDGAGGKKTVRELFKEGIANSGFGAYAEQMKGNIGAMGKLRSMLDTAILTNEDGTIEIKNPSAASIALISLAKNAQGAGQLTDKDVDRISGRQDFGSTIDRFFEKRIGQEITLTDEMTKENPSWLKAINPETGEPFAVGDEVLVGGSEMSVDDVILMREIADGLDSAANNFSQKIIPDIYKNVRGTYGGFTTEQLNQFTDLHQYMPNGIVNLNPLSTVRQKDMQGIYYMMNHEQMTPEEIYSTIRNISIQKGVWDEDTDGPATRAAISEVTKGGYRPRQNQQAIDYQQYKGKGRRVQKNIDKTIIEPDNLEASGNAVKNIMFGAGGTGTGMAAVDMGKGMLDKSRIKKESFPFKKQALNRVKDLSGNELRTVAKDVGVKSSDKMTDTVLRKQVTNKIKQEVKEEVANKLAAMGAKKKVFSALTKLMTSGTVGSVMFVMDLVQADNLPRDAKLSALKDAVNKAKKGSPEREIAQEMFDRAYYSDPRNVRPEEKFMGIKQRKLRHSVELYGL